MRALDFRYISLAPNMPANQTTKPLANGKAARWQGYAARDGLGRTRTRTHVSDASLYGDALNFKKLGKDDKIELNRRMNATLEAMARALFLSWFVDFAPVRARRAGRQLVGLDLTQHLILGLQGVQPRLGQHRSRRRQQRGR